MRKFLVGLAIFLGSVSPLFASGLSYSATGFGDSDANGIYNNLVPSDVKDFVLANYADANPIYWNGHDVLFYYGDSYWNINSLGGGTYDEVRYFIHNTVNQGAQSGSPWNPDWGASSGSEPSGVTVDCTRTACFPVSGIIAAVTASVGSGVGGALGYILKIFAVLTALGIAVLYIKKWLGNKDGGSGSGGSSSGGKFLTQSEISRQFPSMTQGFKSGQGF